MSSFLDFRFGWFRTDAAVVPTPTVGLYELWRKSSSRCANATRLRMQSKGLPSFRRTDLEMFLVRGQEKPRVGSGVASGGTKRCQLRGRHDSARDGGSDDTRRGVGRTVRPTPRGDVVNCRGLGGGEPSLKRRSPPLGLTDGSEPASADSALDQCHDSSVVEEVLRPESEAAIPGPRGRRAEVAVGGHAKAALDGCDEC